MNARFMGSKWEIDIHINSEFTEKTTEGNIISIKENLTQLTLGNNSELKSPFYGRMTTLYICNRSLQSNHFMQIYDFSFQYTLGFCPASVSTSESIDSSK